MSPKVTTTNMNVSSLLPMQNAMMQINQRLFQVEKKLQALEEGGGFPAAASSVDTEEELSQKLQERLSSLSMDAVREDIEKAADKIFSKKAKEMEMETEKKILVVKAEMGVVQKKLEAALKK